MEATGFRLSFLMGLFGGTEILVVSQEELRDLRRQGPAAAHRLGQPPSWSLVSSSSISWVYSCEMSLINLLGF